MHQHRTPALSALIALCVLVLSAHGPRVARAATTYTVAPSGSDTNTGAANAPFRTIQKAASVAQAGDTVLVQAGTYRETITPANSGHDGAPITLQAVGSAVTISGADLVPSTGWTNAGGTAWYAPWPGDYASANNQSDQVFVDGAMVNLARWPEESNRNLSVPKQATMDSIVSATDTGTKAPQVGYPIYRIVFTDAAWDQPDGRWAGARVWVNTGGLDNGPADDTQDGNGQTGVVLGTNLANKQITIEVDAGAATGTTTPGNFQLGVGSRYYLFDPPTADGLLFKGEWWHDRSTKRLYLRTPDGSPPTTHTVEVKQRDHAFSLDNRSYITVSGFHLFAASITTDKDAGNGQGNGNNRSGSIAPANHITLDRLQAQYVSHFTDQTGDLQSQWSQSSGIVLSGANNVIQNSTIAWSAGTGLVVIGKESKAFNNIIHDTNYAATDGGALALGRSPTIVSQDHEISYNTVYNTGVDGIDFSALTNSSGAKTAIRARIHHNLVHDTVLQSADSGGIKAFGSDGRWVRIDHNVVYNTGGADVGDKYVFFGIYLDFPAKDGQYVIDHNVVYNTSTSLNINGMKNLDIFNNTFIARPEVARSPMQANGTLTNVVIRNLLTNRELRIPTSGVTQNTSVFTASDALFENATASDLEQRDYRVKAPNGQVIDAGTDVAPFNDAEPPDIGAYEAGQPRWSVGAVPATTLPPPTPTPTPPPACTADCRFNYLPLVQR